MARTKAKTRKCATNGSVFLNRQPLKLWSFILDTVSCGTANSKKHTSNKPTSNIGSEKLFELLKRPEIWENDDDDVVVVDVFKKEQELELFKKVANKLRHKENEGQVLDGAMEVRLLTKVDPQARTTLALLGVIPPLVALLDVKDCTWNSPIKALYALLNLSISNDMNKAAIVKAGAIHKMLKLIESPHDQCVAEAVVANFLGLSALDSNKSIIGSSGAIPFLVETLKDLKGNVSPQAKQDSLRALYNLSISPTNVLTMLETDLIPFLLSKLGDMDVSERALSILSNVVSVSEGRKVISSALDTISILIDVLNWTDSPACQEKACYILMVMAHKSYTDRRAMIEAGIMSSLLELTLLGSTLAQKRASRMLEFLRVDKGKQVSGTLSNGTLSAPQFGHVSASSAVSSTNQRIESMEKEEEDDMMSQEKKAVKQLVQQSLQSNMNRMVKRANLPHEYVPSDRFKSLTSSSTSKSLPF